MGSRAIIPLPDTGMSRLPTMAKIMPFTDSRWHDDSVIRIIDAECRDGEYQYGTRYL